MNKELPSNRGIPKLSSHKLKNNSLAFSKSPQKHSKNTGSCITYSAAGHREVYTLKVLGTRPSLLTNR